MALESQKGGENILVQKSYLKKIMIQNFPDLIESHRFIVKKL